LADNHEKSMSDHRVTEILKAERTLKNNLCNLSTRSFYFLCMYYIGTVVNFGLARLDEDQFRVRPIYQFPCDKWKKLDEISRRSA